jgi:L-asparaginase II
VEPILVEVSRGSVVEARHRVHAVAVSGGSIVELCGEPRLPTFFRSSAKPFQALPLVRARPDLDDAEVAIACASHLHRPDQLEPVRSLLAKAGATEDDLECSSQNQIEHTCSGKHAGMLLLCHERGWPKADYRLPEHPCQREMLTEVAAAAEAQPETLATAVDGCGVATYALTLEQMARAHSRLEQLEGGVVVARAMRACPGLIRGPGSVDTDLMVAAPGCVAKYGAEGLLCATLEDGVGIAVKVADGAPRPLHCAVAVFLTRLGFETGPLGSGLVENSRGEVVGEIRALVR